MKIFYLEFFINETFSVKKIPNYGNNSVNPLMRIPHIFFPCNSVIQKHLSVLSVLIILYIHVPFNENFNIAPTRAINIWRPPLD